MTNRYAHTVTLSSFLLLAGALGGATHPREHAEVFQRNFFGR